MTIKPPRLEPGDTIGVIAPAGPVELAEIQPAIDLIKERGYHVLLSLNLLKKKGYLAGHDEARLDDLHAMFSDRQCQGNLLRQGRIRDHQASR